MSEYYLKIENGVIRTSIRLTKREFFGQKRLCEQDSSHFRKLDESTYCLTKDGEYVGTTYKFIIL